MSSDDTSQLRHRIDAEELQDLWEQLGQDEPDTDIDLEEVLAGNLHSTLQQFSPGSGLPRGLDLRLVGERLTPGRIDYHVAEDLLRHFAAEVAGAAEVHGMQSAPTLDLVGISQGSTVLHFVPVTGVVERVDDVLVEVDPLDGLMDTITRLHVAAESEADLREFAGHGQLLRALRELLRTLDRHDLSLHLRWRSSVGTHRRSELTTRARDYVRSLWVGDRHADERIITGRVVALALESFTLKASHARNSPRYKIDVGAEDVMIGLQGRLRLGETVSIHVSEEWDVNSLGMGGTPQYKFIGFDSSTPGLFPTPRR